MSEHKLLPIANARDAAKRLDLRRMVVIQEFEDGIIGYTSYGKDREWCRKARVMGNSILRDLGFEVED